MATFQALFDTLRTTLNDDQKARYHDTELLQYGLDGLRETCLARPDLFTVTGTITCVAGVEQAIRPTGWFVTDVFGVAGGDAITEGDFDAMRAYNPGWRRATAGTAVMWMRFPQDDARQPNNKFYVFPPALNGQLLDAAWTEVFTAGLDLNSAIALPEQYHPALQSYVIFRAESKDDEFVNNNRAGLFWANFRAALGVGQASEMVKP